MYYNKYLKYKNKYLNKKIIQYGSAKDTEQKVRQIVAFHYPCPDGAMAAAIYKKKTS
jgi:hypothetical protein